MSESEGISGTLGKEELAGVVAEKVCRAETKVRPGNLRDVPILSWGHLIASPPGHFSVLFPCP